MKLVITFKTATAATKAQWMASEEGIECKLIPTPQKLGVKCGYSLCGEVCDRERIINLMLDKNIQYSEIHEIEA